MTLAAALTQGARLLEDAGIAVPRLTAEVLLAHALRQDRTFLFAHADDELSELGWIHFGRYLHERLNGKPTQYITGRQEWYGRDFRVTPAVLIPRPETEHVIERALEIAAGARRILDVGCGSGIIAITLALELRRPVFASDLSLAALAVARANAQHLHAPVAFFAGDLTVALAPRSLDLLVSNPPYIPLAESPDLPREVRDFEPPLALYGGATGAELYQRLIADASRVLSPGGQLIFELGYRSAPAVAAFLDSRWTGVHFGADLAGHTRVFSARFTG